MKFKVQYTNNSCKLFGILFYVYADMHIVKLLILKSGKTHALRTMYICTEAEFSISTRDWFKSLSLLYILS